MPLNKLFRQDHDDAEALDDLLALELREAIVATREELELYENQVWETIDAKLADRLAHEYRNMMLGQPEDMILARERARVVSDLRAEPDKLRERIADLKRQLAEVEGEQDG